MASAELGQPAKRDFYFGRTPKRRSAKRGADAWPKSRPWSRGIGPRQDFTSPESDEERDRLYARRAAAGSRPQFTLLLSTGGAGAQNHRSNFARLNSLGEKIQVVALCGKDELARENWIHGRRRKSRSRCAPRLHGAMTCCFLASAVVARAGATTAGETLLGGCPPIFNGSAA